MGNEQSMCPGHFHYQLHVPCMGPTRCATQVTAIMSGTPEIVKSLLCSKHVILIMNVLFGTNSVVRHVGLAIMSSLALIEACPMA